MNKEYSKAETLLAILQALQAVVLLLMNQQGAYKTELGKLQTKLKLKFVECDSKYNDPTWIKDLNAAEERVAMIIHETSK